MIRYKVPLQMSVASEVFDGHYRLDLLKGIVKNQKIILERVFLGTYIN